MTVLSTRKKGTDNLSIIKEQVQWKKRNLSVIKGQAK